MCIYSAVELPSILKMPQGTRKIKNGLWYQVHELQSCKAGNDFLFQKETGERKNSRPLHGQMRFEIVLVSLCSIPLLDQQ